MPNAAFGTVDALESILRPTTGTLSSSAQLSSLLRTAGAEVTLGRRRHRALEVEQLFGIGRSRLKRSASFLTTSSSSAPARPRSSFVSQQANAADQYLKGPTLTSAPQTEEFAKLPDAPIKASSTTPALTYQEVYAGGPTNRYSKPPPASSTAGSQGAPVGSAKSGGQSQRNAAPMDEEEEEGGNEAGDEGGEDVEEGSGDEEEGAPEEETKKPEEEPPCSDSVLDNEKCLTKLFKVQFPLKAKGSLIPDNQPTGGTLVNGVCTRDKTDIETESEEEAEKGHPQMGLEEDAKLMEKADKAFPLEHGSKKVIDAPDDDAVDAVNAEEDANERAIRKFEDGSSDEDAEPEEPQDDASSAEEASEASEEEKSEEGSGGEESGSESESDGKPGIFSRFMGWLKGEPAANPDGGWDFRGFGGDMLHASLQGCQQKAKLLPDNVTKLMPGMTTIEMDALSAAAHARVVARTDAFAAQESLEDAIRDAAVARGAADMAHAREPVVDALFEPIRMVKDETLRVFMGLNKDDHERQLKDMQRYLQEQEPSEPLYMPTLVYTAPRLETFFRAS